MAPFFVAGARDAEALVAVMFPAFSASLARGVGVFAPGLFVPEVFVRTTKNGFRRSKTDIKSPATMLRTAAIANGFQTTSFMSIPPVLHKSAQSTRAGTPSSFFIAGIIEQLPRPMQQLRNSAAMRNKVSLLHGAWIPDKIAA